jgi:Caspase domain
MTPDSVLQQAPRNSRIISIILGADRFDGLKSVASYEVETAFRQSKKDVEAYLETIGSTPLDRFNSEELPDELCEHVAEFLRSEKAATDLVVYYIGHGGSIALSDRSEYFLALRRTTDAEKYINGLRVSNFAQVINKNAARIRAIIILDCCYSARAAQYFSGADPDPVGDTKTPFGVTLFAASPGEVEAMVPKGEQHTMFSGCLLEVLAGGIAERGPLLSINEIAGQVRSLIDQRYTVDGVRPEVHSPRQRYGDVADYPLFPNRAYRGTLPSADLKPESGASVETTGDLDFPLRFFVAGAGLKDSSIAVLACAVVEEVDPIQKAVSAARSRLVKSRVLDLDPTTQARLQKSGFDYFVDDPDVRAKFIETIAPLTYEAYTCAATETYFRESAEESVLCELFGRLLIDRIRKHRFRRIQILINQERKALLSLLQGVVSSCVHNINTSGRGSVRVEPVVQVASGREECLELTGYVAAIVHERLDPSTSRTQAARHYRRIESKVRLIRRLDTGEYFSRHHPLPD